MRITYLLSDAGSSRAATWRTLEDAQALKDRGHDVAVVATEGDAAWWGPTDVDVSTSPGHETPRAPDIIVATDASLVSAAVAIADRTGAMAIQWCFGADEERAALGTGHHEAAFRDSEDRVRALLVPNTEVAASISEKFGRRAVVAGTAIDTEVMVPGTVRTNAGRRIRVGLGGRFDVAWEGVATGIEACRLAHQAGLDLELVRFADGAEDSRESHLPFPVVFHRNTSPAETAKALGTLDVMLATHDQAATSPDLNLLRAMACGVPIAAFETEHYRSLGESQFALFGQPNHTAELAEAMVLVVGHSSVGLELRHAGSRLAQSFRIGPHAERLERIYEDLLQSHARRRPEPTPSPRVPTASGPSPFLRARLTPPEPQVAPALPETTPPEPTNRLPDSPAVANTSPNELDAVRDRLVATLRETGELERNNKRWSQAAAMLKAALALAPDDPEILQEHGYVAFLANEDEEALCSYDRLLELGVHGPELHHNRGLVLFAMGDARAAASAFDAATRMPGGDSDAWLMNDLGVARFRCGEADEARAAFEHALRIDPQMNDARANLEELRATQRF